MFTVDVEKLATYQMGLDKGIKKGIEQGIEQGIEKGLHIRDVEIAKNMLARGMEPGLIAAITGLSMEEVVRLRQEGREDRA